MQPVYMVKVFIASPSDVAEERNAAVDVILQWNACNSSDRGITIDPVRMETHAQTTLGGHPQDIVNGQLLGGCDLLIAIFWSRLGTRTPKAASGTVQEINEFIRKNGPKNVLLFFSDRPIPANCDRTELARLKDFKEKMQKKALYIVFNNIDSFRGQLRQQLDRRMNQITTPKSAILSHSTVRTVALEHAMLSQMVTLEPDVAGTRIDDFRQLRMRAKHSLYGMGVGMTFLSADATHMHALLRRGLSIRLLMIDPAVIATSRSRRAEKDSPSVSMMQDAFDALFSRKGYGSDVRTSLSRLKGLVGVVAALKNAGPVELRVYPYFLPMNFTAIDEFGNGEILMEFCLPFSDQRLRMLFTQKHDGQVFKRVMENCETLWTMSTRVSAAHLPSEHKE